MSEYFLEPKSSGATVKVELDLSNYTKKEDLKATVVDTSKFDKKVDLASIKSNVNQLVIVQVMQLKIMLWKMMYIMLRSKILKIKYLILLTKLLILLLMLK